MLQGRKISSRIILLTTLPLRKCRRRTNYVPKESFLPFVGNQSLNPTVKEGPGSQQGVKRILHVHMELQTTSWKLGRKAPQQKQQFESERSVEKSIRKRLICK